MLASADRGTDATAAGWPALEAVRGCARRGGARRAGDVSPSGTLAVLMPIRARSRSLSRAACSGCRATDILRFSVNQDEIRGADAPVRP